MTRDDKNFDFDQMELHGDTEITRREPPRRKKAEKKNSGSSKVGILIFAALFVAAGAAAGYFYKELEGLKVRHQQLLEAKNMTAEDLSEVSESVKAKEQEIADLQGSMQKESAAKQDLAKQKTDLEKAKGSLEKKVTSLEADLKKVRDELAGVRKEYNQSKERVAALEKDKKQVEGKLALAVQDLEAAKRNHAGEKASLQKQMDENQATYQKTLQALQAEKSDLQRNLETTRQAKEKLENNMQEESNAVLQIMDEQKKLRADRDRMAKQIATLEQERNSLKKQLTEASEVQAGDLVAFSEDLTPGRVTYREPLPGGIRIPRRQEPALVQVLVTETGSVSNAFLLPGQQFEPDVARAIIQAVYKYKFSPPTYANMRVRTWQPVAVYSE